MSRKQSKKVMRVALAAVGLVALMFVAVNIYRNVIADASQSEDSQNAETVNITGAAAISEGAAAQAEAAATVDPAETEQQAKREVLDQYMNLAVVDNTNFLNIRDMPTMDGTIIGKLSRYNAMNILQDMENGWFHIQSGGVDGYIDSEFVVTGEAAEQLAVDNCVQMLEIKLPTVDVHRTPDSASEIWTQLRQDERYIIKEKVGDWYRLDFNSEDAYVLTSDGDVGYYLLEAQTWSTLDNCSPQRKELIEYGMQYLGVPYVWGGSDFSTGVDCSGFTLLCFNHIGITIPRVSYVQATVGQTVNSLAEAKPGDLLFYADANNKVNHVAIYIGDNKILQAANSLHQVTISNYNYNTEPVLIKNIIGD